ncbi:MAG: division plane positioning ATPase MipZ [Candidatus Tectomicrobia bacterium]
MIVVVGGLKGGSGKITVALHLAIMRVAQGHDVLVIDADDQETTFDFTRLPNTRTGNYASYTCLKLPPYAQGFAEDFARLQGMERLVDVDAPWWQDPDTEKQTALLGKLGVAVRPKLTKGEAADLITAVLGDWDEDADHGRHRLLSLSHAVHPQEILLDVFIILY